jgi:hypothetical protein
MPIVNKKRYHKLDDIGFVGRQEQKSPASKSYHARKTAAVFQAVRSSPYHESVLTGKKQSDPAHKL